MILKYYDQIEKKIKHDLNEIHAHKYNKVNEIMNINIIKPDIDYQLLYGPYKK